MDFGFKIVGPLAGPLPNLGHTEIAWGLLGVNLGFALGLPEDCSRMYDL